MAIVVKDWKDGSAGGTNISAASLEDLEARMGAYTDLAMGRYGTVINWRSIAVPQSTAAATLFLPESGSTGLAAATGDSPLAVVYIDPADYTVPNIQTKFRVRAVCLTNATAPAINFTVGLYPVTAVAGGANVITMTPGAVQGGSTVLFTAPALSTPNQNNSGDFTGLVAGYYAFGVVLSGTNAASSRVIISATLQYHNAA